MARPTDYTPELLEKAREYAANWSELGDNIPSVAGLALHIGVARKTIYDWISQEDKRVFCNIVEEVLIEQEKRLINKGLSGEFNSSITKLMLTKHDYTDKQDITSDGKALPSPILNGISVHNGDEEDSKAE